MWKGGGEGSHLLPLSFKICREKISEVTTLKERKKIVLHAEKKQISNVKKNYKHTGFFLQNIIWLKKILFLNLIY